MIKSSIFNLKTLSTIFQGRIPGQLIIQYTDYCNATCPQCGMNKNEHFQRNTLSNIEMYRIIDAAAKKKFQSISFTGGEPFIYKKQLISLMKYASYNNIPYIRTGTNGFMFMDHESPDFLDKTKAFVEELAETNVRNLWISIDSIDEKTHESMRGLPGVIKGIEKALPIFHEYGLYPAANLGINRNTGGPGKIPMTLSDESLFFDAFKESFSNFYEFVISLGFTMVNACYPMSMDEATLDTNMSAVYGAHATDKIISFTKKEKVQLFKALLSTIPDYRDKIKIFTPLSSVYALIKQYEGDDSFAMPCRGGIDFFFIDAKDGNTYPCGYRGNESLGKIYDLDVESLPNKPFCKACDWECFRDPSEMIGYLVDSLKHPLAYLTSKNKDKTYKKLWLDDLKYYKKCNYFDGRQ